MYGLGQPPPTLPTPLPAGSALPGSNGNHGNIKHLHPELSAGQFHGQMNPSYQPNSLPGYPATTPTAAAYASNATSPRGTPPTVGFSPSVYAQGATYGYGAPTYHGSSSYPYSAVYSSASTVPSPYNPSSYTQQAGTSAYSASSLSSAYPQAVQQGMIPTLAMIQGVPRTVYVTDTRVSPVHGQLQGQQKPTIPSSAGLMSGAALGTTSPHAAAAAAAQAAYYQSPTWQQQQQQQQQVQPHRTFNPNNPYGPHW